MATKDKLSTARWLLVVSKTHFEKAKSEMQLAEKLYEDAKKIIQEVNSELEK